MTSKLAEFIMNKIFIKKKCLILGALIFLLISSCQKAPEIKHEIRAVWMSRFEYAKGETSEESRQYIKRNFSKFARAGFNMIIFQIRGQADAFYKSDYEPWSLMLSDSLGKNPGWDPLRFAIEEARKNGLELHAWINTFSAWKTGFAHPVKSDPLHPLLAHPDWIVCDSSGSPMKPKAGYITFSPGIPAVQEHITRVVLDITAKYDVDGIHFDYIRYPEETTRLGYSHDSISVKRYHSLETNPYQYEWNTWQREQINQFTASVYNAITDRKPWVIVSAAVLGRHAGKGWTGYDAVFQDARRWLATGKMDMIFPMTYHRIEHPVLPFGSSLIQWKSMFYLDRPIVPGIATYKVGKAYGWPEIWDQIEMARNEGFPGMVFFSANSVSKALDEIEERYYPKASLLPPMEWKQNVAVVEPEELFYYEENDSINLNWTGSNGVAKYVLYRNRNIEDPANIERIMPGHRTLLKLKKTSVNKAYYLTAVNRVGLESKPFPFILKPIASKY